MSVCEEEIFKETFNTDFAARCKEMMRFVLKTNIFQFDDAIYRQKHGTAMGTRFAPSFANLFMARLEESFIETRRINPFLWRRNIDDIYMIWADDMATLQSFLDDLNSFNHHIKFTYAISESEVIYLDVNTFKGNRFNTSGILDIKTFFKKTNAFMYVPFDSDHPLSVKKAVAIGECHRFLRSTSSESDYSGTCLIRPPMGRDFTGRNIQVVSIRKKIFFDKN